MKKRICVCDDTCPHKCKSRREHDLREDAKVDELLGFLSKNHKRIQEQYFNPVLGKATGGALKKMVRR